MSPKACLLAPLVLLSACASAGLPLSKVAAQANASQSGSLVIAAGDTIDVSFAQKPEWNQVVTVKPDGTANFIVAAPLDVGGRSIQDLKERLQEAVAPTLPEADVSVGISSFGDRYVYVMGDVKEPGEIPLEGRLTFLEAIARAGGPMKETALMKRIVLVRWNARTRSQQKWQIDAREDTWGDGQPLLLQAYDVIFVPNKPIDDLDIWVDQYIRRLLPFPYLVSTPGGTP